MGDNFHLPIVGKGNKARTVYLPAQVMGRIAEYLNPQVFILETNRGTQFDPINLYRRVRKITSKAINKPVSPHAFRHSCAMTLLDQGMDIKSVSHYLGHSHISVTLQYYIHHQPNAENVGKALMRHVDEDL